MTTVEIHNGFGGVALIICKGEGFHFSRQFTYEELLTLIDQAQAALAASLENRKWTDSVMEALSQSNDGKSNDI